MLVYQRVRVRILWNEKMRMKNDRNLQFPKSDIATPTAPPFQAHLGFGFGSWNTADDLKTSFWHINAITMATSWRFGFSYFPDLEEDFAGGTGSR